MKKILLAISLAFVISFSFFIFFQYQFQKELNINERQFFSRQFDDSRSKILLLGSSHVGMLDASEIEKIINQHNEYEVFNLAKGSDTPTKRLKQLPQILSLKPKLVVYGIGYRDFDNSVSDNGEHVLPDPSSIIKNAIPLEVDFLNNPKLTTLNVFRNVIGIKSNQNSSLTSTPFFPYSENHYEVMKLDDIRNSYKSTDFDIKISSVDKNPELKSLDMILNELEENNIDVVLFITPHNTEYINGLSITNKENFADILDHIERNHDIHINSLMQNYTDLEIWSSPNHITHGSKGLIYNNDVAKIILKELIHNAV